MSNYAHPEVLVDTQWVADHLDDPHVRVVEIDGNNKAYDAGHIHGAVFWNYNQAILLPDRRVNVNKTVLAELLARCGIANDTTVIFYGHVASSAWAIWFLKLFGHTDARVMNGGRKKWMAEGRPLTTETPTITPSSYTAREHDASKRALRDYVQESIGRADRVSLDVRTPQEYSGEWFVTKPPEGTERAGHIPGAAHVFFEMAMGEDGTFKSVDQLQALYSSQGVTPNKEVIPYCTIGGRSGHTAFVLEYLLGYPNVRHYDASWNEWGRLPDTPIEK